MQLSFLGQSYSASAPIVDVIPTEETGTFLGRSYVRKRVTVHQRQEPAVQLTYRGCRYSH